MSAASTSPYSQSDNTVSTVLFTTVPLADEFGGPDKSWIRVKNDVCVSSLATCGKILAITGEKITPRYLDHIITDFFDAFMELCMKTLGYYRLGPILGRVTVTGTTSDPLCASIPDDCTAKILISPATGYEREVDSTCVTFVNEKNGDKVVILRFRTQGEKARSEWRRDSIGVLGGSNLFFIEGDSITASYEKDGSTVTISLCPTESDASYLKVAWPEELADVAIGTELTLTLTSRAGNAGATPQVSTIKVKIAEAAP